MTMATLSQSLSDDAVNELTKERSRVVVVIVVVIVVVVGVLTATLRLRR